MPERLSKKTFLLHFTAYVRKNSGVRLLVVICSQYLAFLGVLSDVYIYDFIAFLLYICSLKLC